MRVGDLASGPVVAMQADDSLLDAAREMDDNSQDAVAVYEGAVLVGVLSVRDVIRAAAEGASLERTSVEDYMTTSPATLPGDTPPEDALRAMLDGDASQLPVVDEEGEVSAMLTVADVARSMFTASAGRKTRA